MKRLLLALLISVLFTTTATADEPLRTAFWLSSLTSLGGIGQQQHDGVREINPALSGLFGEHPSFAEVAGLNLAYGVLAERLYQRNPTMARWLWGLGTAMAVYWIAYDADHDVDGPDRVIRISFKVFEW